MPQPAPLVFRAYRVDILAEENDGERAWRLRAAFFAGPQGLRRIALRLFEEADANAIVLWTRRAAESVQSFARFSEIAHERQFLLLPCDGTLIPEPLSDLRRLEWTKPADVYWQWRVANGAPVNHVKRPWSPPE
jgi:hypothetical protein